MTYGSGRRKVQPSRYRSPRYGRRARRHPVVLDGYDGHGFECQLPTENLPNIVKALREVADKLEQDIAHQSLVSATSKERAGQQ